MTTSSNGNTFPRYWPFVRGIHRSPVNSPGSATAARQPRRKNRNIGIQQERLHGDTQYAADARLLRAIASVFFEEHRPQKLPIHGLGLYAGVARDSCLPCKCYCRAASRAAACRAPVALLVASRVNVPLGCGKLSKVSDSKVHGINMEPIWGRQDPGGPRVGPMNFGIWGSKGGYRSQPIWKKYKAIAICYFKLTCFINCPLADTSTNWYT